VGRASPGDQERLFFADPLALFLERARHLGPKLGPILVQLPPGWNADPERLAPPLGPGRACADARAIVGAHVRPRSRVPLARSRSGGNRRHSGG
jgi:hypothetical protein